MIIKPQTMKTSALERDVLRAALELLIKNDRKKLMRAKRADVIDALELRVAHSQDMIVRINEGETK